jgi:hypothetical protein
MLENLEHGEENPKYYRIYATVYDGIEPISGLIGIERSPSHVLKKKK